MHCHCGTNNKAPRWTFTDPCKPEVRPSSREESASPAWLAAPAMNAHDTTKVYIWRPYTGCGRTLYRKFTATTHQEKMYNNTWVESLAGNCTTKVNMKNIQCILSVWTTYFICASENQRLFIWRIWDEDNFPVSNWWWLESWTKWKNC